MRGKQSKAVADSGCMCCGETACRTEEILESSGSGAIGDIAVHLGTM